MKGLWLVFWILVLVLVNGTAAEMRGIWVDAFGSGFKTKEEVKQLVADCHEYNFNAVFVQMRKRGDAYYIPEVANPDVRAMDIHAGYDALAELVSQCHNAKPRIEVHCWVLAYFVWAFDKPPLQKEHIFNLRPDLLTTDSLGQKALDHGYYLDPGHPEVPTILRNIAKDIVGRYDIDGLQWDYLRYPARDSGYNKVALERYKQELKTEKDPDPADPKFCEWRQKQITDFLRVSSAELHAIKPHLLVSAAVFSNYKDSRNYRMADWVRWAELGVLDANIPMDFSPDFRVFSDRVDFALANQKGRSLYIGQGAYMNSLADTLKQLNYSRSKGAAGSVFYSYRNPSKTSNRIAEQKEFDRALSKNDQIIVDNKKAEISGSWQSGQFGKYYGEDYLFAAAGSGSNSVTFRPALELPSTYGVYEWHVQGTNRSRSVPHIVYSGSSSSTVWVNQRVNGSRWNHLGDFTFTTNGCSVVIGGSGQESNRVVTADALRFIRLPAATSLDENEKHKDFDQYLRRERARVFTALRREYQPTWETTDSSASEPTRALAK